MRETNQFKALLDIYLCHILFTNVFKQISHNWCPPTDFVSHNFVKDMFSNEILRKHILDDLDYEYVDNIKNIYIFARI